jgi:DNA invertase Pin-like site-specific DNA recombinase
MGRLTLNVLLSFAQFEREVTSERIRDKISASKPEELDQLSKIRQRTGQAIDLVDHGIQAKSVCDCSRSSIPYIFRTRLFRRTVWPQIH